MTGSAALAELPTRYRLILCDIWGVVHDGVHVFRDAEARLREWRSEGRTVLLITNAPRPATAVQAQLDRLELDRAAYDDIVTSGDTGLAALRAEGLERAGFIGTAVDKAILEESGIRLIEGGGEEIVVCTGLPDGTVDPAAMDPVLRDMIARDAVFFCFNPDRIVLRGGIAEPCAGAIADRYDAMGGRVTWFGKPYAPIYRQALAVGSRLAARPLEPRETLAVGDSLVTDAVGAAEAGFDFVFITHGIEGERIAAEGLEARLRAFGREWGIMLPPPLAIAPRLA